MAWTGIYSRNVSDIFNMGVDGYFGFQSLGIRGPAYPVQLDDQSTTNRLTLQSSTQGIGFPLFLSEITFVGTGLQIGATNEPLPGGVGSIPRLVAGTVTQIIVRVNLDLINLQTALGLATSQAERNRIQALIPEVATEAHLRSQPAAAVISTDPFAAAALGTAVVQSFVAGNDGPLRAFLSQFSHVSTTLAADSDLVGFDNNDVLIGGPGITNIFAGGGNDTLDGGGGTNGMNGQGGADFYIMGAGPDRIADDGTEGGIDIASYQNAPGPISLDMENTGTIPQTGWAQGDAVGGVEGIIGSAFSDLIVGRTTVLGPTSSDLLQGGAGDDTLIGGEGSDTLIGGPGNDAIDGGGNQSVVGGPGPGDMAVYSAGPNEVHFFNSASGLLVVTPLGGVDLVRNVELFSFAGQVFGLNQISLSGANLRIGQGNPETIDGGAGVDLLFGGGGNDQLSGAGANDILDGGFGDDSLSGGEGDDTLVGGAGADTLEGGAGNDSLLAGDSVFDLGGLGCGGTGADRIEGEGGHDSLNGGADDDLIGGGAGEDSILGEGGNDSLYGGVGNDTIRGGAGDDLIQGAAGRNALFGDDGADQIFTSAGGDFVGGGAGNDTIRGAEGADTIYGGAGNDNLAGGAGSDQIFGSAGANVIWAGLGNDTVQGGSGSDTIHGGAGRNVLLGNDGGDVILAGTGGDFIGGGAGDDTLRGGAGNDTIYAGAGTDNIGGGAGNDVIFGSVGASTLWGGTGDDTLHAGTGRDVMVGGPGADRFVFASAAAIGIGAGRDIITDFTPGVDQIDLTALGTSLRASGLAGGGTASFFYFAAAGLVIGDQTGDGIADWVIQLSGAPALTAGDFLL